MFLSDFKSQNQTEAFAFNVNWSPSVDIHLGQTFTKDLVNIQTIRSLRTPFDDFKFHVILRHVVSDLDTSSGVGLVAKFPLFVFFCVTTVNLRCDLSNMNPIWESNIWFFIMRNVYYREIE